MNDENGPARLAWNYDRAEVIADAVVHAIGGVLGLIGAVVLIVVASRSQGMSELPSVVVYAVALLGMLGFSAAYNLWPISRAKWLLRRFDHSAIYLLIAGTYTPFVAQLKIGLLAIGSLAGIWTAALAGIVLKLALPGRFDRLSIGLYLLLGWSGLILYDSVIAELPGASLWLLGAGGLLYTVGIIFHLWRGLRFQNAIWHGFVILAAACHYGAVLGTMVLPHA